MHNRVPAAGDRIPLTVAARLPRLQINGRPTPVTNIFRWSLTGVRGVKLRTEVLGGKRWTCAAWVDEFLDELARRDGARTPVRVETPRQRDRDAAAAEAELAAGGFDQVSGRPSSARSPRRRSRAADRPAGLVTVNP